MTPEQAEKIIDNMSEDNKRELVLMIKIREMHDEDTFDTQELKMTLMVLLESVFPQLMIPRHKIPKTMPDTTTGLTMNVNDTSMMAGFFGGVLAVLNITGMPAVITDEIFLHTICNCIASVKIKQMEDRIKEKANGNKKQCAEQSTQGAASEA